MVLIFEVKNGTFGYNNKCILNDINFSVESGEVMTVLGSNGVGKTTLLKCMMGFLKWNKGETFIDGVAINQLKPQELWKKIAYVAQAKGSVFAYSALDMVVLGRSAHIGTFKQPQKEDIDIAIQAMEDVGILHLQNKLCTQMSGGELQMVLIARALSVSPNMLVLDEPESNLDFKNQLIVLNTIKNLAKERNISAIVNTHYPAHALQISDKALLLNRDGSSNYGETDSVINEQNMKDSFGVRVHIGEFIHNNICYKNVIPLHLV